MFELPFIVGDNVKCCLDNQTPKPERIAHDALSGWYDAVGFSFKVYRYDTKINWNIAVNENNCHLIDYLVREWDSEYNGSQKFATKY